MAHREGGVTMANEPSLSPSQARRRRRERSRFRQVEAALLAKSKKPVAPAGADRKPPSDTAHATK
jgi:hypothetical protein